MLGLWYRIETRIFSKSTSVDTYTYFGGFGLEFIPGIITAIILAILSILIILNANSGKGMKVKKKGIISLILLVVEYAWFYYAFVLSGYFNWMDSVTIYPYIGFFGILIGGILAIIGGNKLK